MDIIEIRLNVGHTVNLGDFNSIRIDAGLTITIKPGDDLEKIRADAQTVLRNMLEETFRAQQRKAKHE